MEKNKNIMPVIGFMIICYIIWIRLIRERLPKALPFELNIWMSILILVICICNIYVIFRLLIPLNKESSWLTSKLSYIGSIFLQPLLAFDNTIKNNKYIHLLYIKLIETLPSFVLYYKTVDSVLKIHVIFYVIPRIIFLSIFCLDVYYFCEIRYTYNFSGLLLFILFYKYILYSFKQTLYNYIEFLKTWFFVEITSENIESSEYFTPISQIQWLDNSQELSLLNGRFDIHYKWLEIESFLELQTAAIAFDNVLYTYKSVPKYILLKKYAEENNMDIFIVQLQKDILDSSISKDFYYKLPITLHLYLLIDNFNYVITRSPKINKALISITFIYLVTWLYIFYSSFNIALLYPLLCIFDPIEPFSGLFI